MDDHILDSLASLAQILSGVESGWIVHERAADGGGHGKSDIGVDIDLADGKLCRAAKLCLGNTDSVGHFAAESVDLADEFLRHGGRTVKNYRELGQTL